MKTVFALTALILALAIAPVSTSRASDPGPVVLTILGKVGNPNRPAFDPFKDAFLKGQDRNFEKAHVFDRAVLKTLPQVTVSAHARNWPKPVTASGPRLKDVLAAAGVADDAALTLVALDGYGAAFDVNDRKAEDWVLAIDADGEPLAIGGRGPAWLLYDTGGKPATEEAESRWVWSVYVIEAE